MLVWPIGEGKLKYAQVSARESGQKFEQQKAHPMISQDDFFVFLKSRAGKLDAVVITGGEPCLQKDLLEFIKKVKALGYLVKLDTNGSHPEVLAELIKEKLIDYIAMDLKAPENKYEAVTGIEADFKNIKKSVKMIITSGLPPARAGGSQAGLPYEFRTTMVPDLLDKDDISEMGKIISGADLWYLQNFKSQSDLVNQEFKGKVPYNARQMDEMAEIGRKYVKICEVR